MSVMNITNNAVVNNCTDKCALSFNYPDSPNCIVENGGSYFNLSYNIDPTLTPVTFNNSQYKLDYLISFTAKRIIEQTTNSTRILFL